MADSHVNEEWRPVVGYEGLYEVSDLGRVRSLDGIRWNGKVWHPFKGRVLRASPVNGYPKITLWRDNQEKRQYVHRLVLESFSGACPPGMQVRHKNGKRDDPRRSNLRWGTQSENEQDKRAHGTYFGRPRKLYGEKGPNARLTDKEVREIHTLSASGMRQRDIAKRVGSSQVNVWRILHGHIWPHIYEEVRRGVGGCP